MFPELLLVLRPDDRELAREVETASWPGRIRSVFCADAHLGMGHSLACGARAAGVARWTWLFVALGDMAWVRADTLILLRDALLEAPPPAIVQPIHAGAPGHPVGFSGSYLSELTALTGDEGARALIRRAGPALRRIPVDDPGVHEDLDAPPGTGGPAGD